MKHLLPWPCRFIVDATSAGVTATELIPATMFTHWAMVLAGPSSMMQRGMPLSSLAELMPEWDWALAFFVFGASWFASVFLAPFIVRRAFCLLGSFFWSWLAWRTALIGDWYTITAASAFCMAGTAAWGYIRLVLRRGSKPVWWRHYWSVTR